MLAKVLVNGVVLVTLPTQVLVDGLTLSLRLRLVLRVFPKEGKDVVARTVERIVVVASQGVRANGSDFRLSLTIGFIPTMKSWVHRPRFGTGILIGASFCGRLFLTRLL